MILTETWCNSNRSIDILQIPGYTIEESLRKDRQDTVNGIGGGIIVYVRLGLTVLSLDNFTLILTNIVIFNVLTS